MDDTSRSVARRSVFLIGGYEPKSSDAFFKRTRRELARFGFDSVVVWALADNENACRFYRNAGGRKVARANERFGSQSLTKIAYAWGRGA